jgi:hypothetical protein
MFEGCSAGWRGACVLINTTPCNVVSLRLAPQALHSSLIFLLSLLRLKVCGDKTTTVNYSPSPLITYLFSLLAKKKEEKTIIIPFHMK